MTKDEIWEELKRDETKIYGQSLFDVFVQTTDNLTLKHFMELDKESRNKISGGSVISMLLVAPNKKDVASILGKENINRLSEKEIEELLNPFWGWGELEPSKIQEIRQELIEILQYKEHLTDADIIKLLLYAPNKKEIVKTIGQERIDNLQLTSIDTYLFIVGPSWSAASRLRLGKKTVPSTIDDITDLKNITDIFGKEKVGRLINALDRSSILSLFYHRYSTGDSIQQDPKKKRKMIEILGKENMNKLTRDDWRSLKL